MSHAFNDNPRCNNLECRKELNDKAVVTTCCHIYCFECASREGLVGAVSSDRRCCPTCQQPLRNADDVALRDLQCTEEYKTIVLSGLKPGVIMECAGRAMSFWEYQCAQEIGYHKYLNKSQRKRHGTERRQLETMVSEARGMVNEMQSQMAELQAENRELMLKVESLDKARADIKKRLDSQHEYFQTVQRSAAMNNMAQAFAEGPRQPIPSNMKSGNLAMLPKMTPPHPLGHDMAHGRAPASGFQIQAPDQNMGMTVWNGGQPPLSQHWIPRSNGHKGFEPPNSVLGMRSSVGMVSNSGPRPDVLTQSRTMSNNLGYSTNNPMHPIRAKSRGSSVSGAGGTYGRKSGMGLSSGIKMGQASYGGKPQ